MIESLELRMFNTIILLRDSVRLTGPTEVDGAAVTGGSKTLRKIGLRE